MPKGRHKLKDWPNQKPKKNWPKKAKRSPIRSPNSGPNAVSYLAAVVDSSAEAGSLTHVKHCAAEVLHMISKDRVVGVVADSTKAGRKSGHEIVVAMREVAASGNKG